MTAESASDLAAKSGLTVTEIKRPKPRQGKGVPRSVTAYVEVRAEVDADDLHDGGWHHENECPAGGLGVPLTAPVSLVLGWTTVTAALDSLHQQAHGAGPILTCGSEPCRSLSLDQLRGAA